MLKKKKLGNYVLPQNQFTKKPSQAHITCTHPSDKVYSCPHRCLAREKQHPSLWGGSREVSSMLLAASATSGMRSRIGILLLTRYSSVSHHSLKMHKTRYSTSVQATSKAARAYKVRCSPGCCTLSLTS